MENSIKEIYIGRINSTLNQLRPYLQSDGGDVEFVELTDDFIVKVRFLGACENCNFNFQTLKAGIESSLKKSVPEIAEVIEA